MEPDKFEALAKDASFIRAAKTLVARRKEKDDSIPMQVEDAKVRKWTGGKYGRSDVDAWLSEAAKPSAQNVLESIGQGATFNFLDELRGKAKGETARDAMRLQEGSYTDQNPGKALLGNIAGGLINPVSLAATAVTAGAANPLLAKLGLSGLVAGAKALPALVKAGVTGVTVGGSEGALMGAGAGTTPEERIVGAKQGAVGGTVAGLVPAALGAAGKGLKYATSSAEEKAAAVFRRRVEQVGGRDPLVAAATDQTDAGLTPAVADLPGMRGVHDIATNADLATRDATEKLVAARRLAAPGQVRDALEASLPADVSTEMGQRATEMAQARRAKFDPLYESMNPPIDPMDIAPPGKVLGHQPTVAEVAADATHPLNKKALAMAANGPQVQAMPMPGVAPLPPEPAYAGMAKFIKQDPKYFGKAWKDMEQSAMLSDTPTAGRPTVDMLRRMRTQLQDDVEELFRAGRAGDALELKKRIGAVNGALDHETGGIGKSIDAQYRAQMDAERALLDGRSWYTSQSLPDKSPVTIAALKSKMASLSPEELDAFKTGVASSVKADLEHSATNRNVSQELLNASDYRKSMFHAVFGTTKNLNTFMEKVNQLAQQAKLARTVAGSETELRGAGAAMAAPTMSLSNPVSSVGNIMKAGVTGGMPPAKQAFGAALGKLTLTQGTPNIDAMLKKMLTPPTAVTGALENPMTSVGVGAASAANATQP